MSFDNPLAVAVFVAQYGGDEDLQIAALLHDVLEDGGPRNEGEIAAFGERVLRVVRARWKRLKSCNSSQKALFVLSAQKVEAESIWHLAALLGDCGAHPDLNTLAYRLNCLCVVRRSELNEKHVEGHATKAIRACSARRA